MGGDIQEIHERLDNLQAQNEGLASITQEIKEVTDNITDDKDRIELSGKLDSGLASILEKDHELATNLLGIMEEINPDNYKFNDNDKKAREELKNFITPYTKQIATFTYNNQGEIQGNFYKNLLESETNQTKNQINELIGKLQDNYDDSLKTSLKNILNILENPNKVNTQALQNFLKEQLTGDDYINFINNNFKGKEDGEPDGLFGRGTLNGLNVFLNETKNYISQLVESKEIQNAHDAINDRNNIEQDMINNLTFTNVIEDAPFEDEDEQIKNLIENIINIEGREDIKEEDRPEKETTLNKKIEERDQLKKDIENWNTDRNNIIQYFKEHNQWNNNRENRNRVKNQFSEENFNRAKDKLNELNNQISILEDQLNGKKPDRIIENINKIEEYYKGKIKNLEIDITKLNEEKGSETPDIPNKLKEYLKEKEIEIDNQINEKTEKINKILGFFGWKKEEDTGEIINNEDVENNYKLYKQKYDVLIKKDDDE